MATLGTGRAKKVAKVQTTEQTTELQTQTPVETPTKPDGSIDYGALYDQCATSGSERANHSLVTSTQIREAIDAIFDAGHEEVALATVCATIDKAYGLGVTGEGDSKVDTRVRYASVRSAGMSGKKYLVEQVNNQAVFVKNPDYVAPKAA